MVQPGADCLAERDHVMVTAMSAMQERDIPGRVRDTQAERFTIKSDRARHISDEQHYVG